MNILIPFISAFLFWAGGRDQWLWCPWNQKLWRWGMGIPLAYMTGNIWLILTYLLATWVSGYGENHFFRKWFGRDVAWWLYGGLFGLASLPVLGMYSFIQTIAGATCFMTLMQLSNDGFGKWKLQHQYVEIIFGFLGTIGYLWI